MRFSLASAVRKTGQTTPKVVPRREPDICECEEPPMVVGCVRQGYRNFSRLGSKPNPCASPRGFFFPQGHARLLLMATGKKDGGREAELEAAIEKIRLETWKAGQTLPKLRH